MDCACRKTIQLLKKWGVDYADIRVHLKDETEYIGTVCGTIDSQGYSVKQGFGVRVLYNGAWGFASSENFEDLDAFAAMAVAHAKAAALMNRQPIQLIEKPVVCDVYKDPVNRDPFTISLSDKINHFLKLDKTIQTKGLSYWGASAQFYKQNILFFDTDGSEIQKHLVDVNAGLFALANDKEGRQQRRSHTLFLDANGTIGWDNVLEQKQFVNYAATIPQELLAVCQAPECGYQETDLILLNNQMALQTHETIGHALELDRILGYELSYAGGSIVRLSDFGTLQYGAPKLTVRANGLIQNSPGSFGYDDDGVKAQNITLIEKGNLVSAICARQMAAEANTKAGKTLFKTSGGTNRASSYNRPPIERMNNINIDPGPDGILEDLIAGCENGIMMDTPSSWSIGSNRESFHFACEIGWKIKDGAITHVIRNPSYRGETIPFWNSLTKVGSAETWHLEPVFHCGKGQPNQIMKLGHGVPICLFKGIQIGEKNEH